VQRLCDSAVMFCSRLARETHDPCFAHALQAWRLAVETHWSCFGETHVLLTQLARCRHARARCNLQPRLSSHPAAPILTGPLPRHSYTAAYHQQPQTTGVHSCRPRRTAEGQAPERCGGAGAAARRETGPLTAPLFCPHPPAPSPPGQAPGPSALVKIVSLSERASPERRLHSSRCRPAHGPPSSTPSQADLHHP
jgi:hypothetical protein